MFPVITDNHALPEHNTLYFLAVFSPGIWFLSDTGLGHKKERLKSQLLLNKSKIVLFCWEVIWCIDLANSELFAGLIQRSDLIWEVILYLWRPYCYYPICLYADIILGTKKNLPILISLVVKTVNFNCNK